MNKQIEQLAEHFKIIGNEFKKSSICSLKNDCNLKNMRIIEFLSAGKKTMSQLSTEMNLTPGSMTSVIDILISKKYVKRECDNKDRRKVYIILIKKGKDISNIIIKEHLKISKTILNFLNKKETLYFLNILDKITQGIESKK